MVKHADSSTEHTVADPRRDAMDSIGLLAAMAIAAGPGWWFGGKKVWTDGGVIRDSRCRSAHSPDDLDPAGGALGARINTEGQEYEPSISPTATSCISFEASQEAARTYL